MRRKIKLINICIRHKCSNSDENSSKKLYKLLEKKNVRRVKKVNVTFVASKNEAQEKTVNEHLDSAPNFFENSMKSDDYDVFSASYNMRNSSPTFDDFHLFGNTNIVNNTQIYNDYNISNDAGLKRLHRNTILQNPCQIPAIDSKVVQWEQNCDAKRDNEENISNDAGLSGLHRNVIFQSPSKISVTDLGNQSKDSPGSEYDTKVPIKNEHENSIIAGKFNIAVDSKLIGEMIKNLETKVCMDKKETGEIHFNAENHEWREVPKINNNENYSTGVKPDEQNVEFIENGETRFNELNLQMLSQKLYKQIFPNSCAKNNLKSKKLSSLKNSLLASGMRVEDISKLPDVDIDIPPLEGKNIEEHFYNIAKDQTKAYKKIVYDILKELPKMPEKWVLREGWTRYSKEGITQVDYPLEDGMVFDVEVCMKEGSLPTLATAVTKEAWYGWASKSVVTGTSMPVESRALTTDLLIPLESSSEEHGKKLTEKHKKPKIIIGHNVSYDRQRIKEQYWLNCTGARFVDTMSMHIAISGLNSYQRIAFKTEKPKEQREDWELITSLNGLGDVFRLYCNEELDKNPRNVFVEGTLLEIQENFQSLMKYCALDVLATHKILRKLFPMFEERFPHPVTFAGMLELGSAYLPVNSNWNRYIEESESTFEDLNYESKSRLARRADEVCKLMENDKYREDIWMWDQDWSVQSVKIKKTLTKQKLDEIEREEMRMKKTEESDFEKYLTDGEDEENELEKEFKYLWDTKYYLPVKFPHMSGYPAWYRKMCMKYTDENWSPGPQKISTSMQVVPKLLNLTWDNYPLHYIKEHGWGILVPFEDNTSVVTVLPLKQMLIQRPLPEQAKRTTEFEYEISNLRKDVQEELMKHEFWRFKKSKKKSSPPKTFYNGTGVWCNVEVDNCCWFFKLPHKDGGAKNVGNPLARDFLNKFSENVLVGLDSSASEILQIARSVSYWRNNRDRIMSQMVVWLAEENLPSFKKSTGGRMRYGAIVPQVVVSGTVTRRATEPTWMTASNSSTERIGSELRAIVQAPPGYSIVGADVDSQELWIASVIGDADCAGIHGATPFGWMTLIGSKSKGTDMHSVTAKAVGISRDHAKIINYARIYGAGQKFAERLLKRFNPTMNDSEASSKSRKMFSMTKGNKVYQLKPEFMNADVKSGYYTSWEAQSTSKLHGKSIDEMFERGRWIGGTESAMFNRLEEIAGMAEPKTPFLNSRLSRALEAAGGPNDKYLPTKINWVVQSGAVDFLHLMLVSMRWLMRDNARFCLSFHDEIRYLLPAKFKYNAALAMHLTNLMTRAFCSSRLGIEDLPMSVAFFASVEVDTVLRKEASSDCKTPSNPHGLENGYGVPLGESLDVWKAVEKSGGSLGHWHVARNKKRGKIDKSGENNTEENP